ncbi:MAG: hypothetical protein V1808_00905 [Candidatus Daviesbacteria bacterium]
MIILPIKLITETDQSIFGANIYHLARLAQDDFPVPSGLAISPPEIILATVLKHFETLNKEVFEQSLEVVKKDILKIPLPEELEKELAKKKEFLLNEEILKKKEQLWLKLLEIWLEEIRSRIWREGFAPKLSSDLQSQTVFFIKDKFISVSAYFDPNLDEVMIQSQEKLYPQILQKIDQLVLSGNKRLILPQIYHFAVIKNQVYLIKLMPFTQTLPVSDTPNVLMPKTEQKKIIRCAVKVFLNLSSGFATSEGIDGVLIEGEKLEGFDESVFKLSEAALSFPQSPVIFKLPDIKDEDIGGSLRLLNHQSLLKNAVDVFLFVRNKKNLFNLEIAVPKVRSLDELLQIKKELGSLGINRRGALKLWLEVCIPENIINLEQYLESGLDGIILDLDEMQQALGGYENKEGEYYKKQVQTLIQFLCPAFKILHKNKILILAKGELANYPEVLDFLVEGGVWGIVVNTPMEAESMPENLHLVESRMLLRRSD